MSGVGSLLHPIGVFQPGMRGRRNLLTTSRAGGKVWIAKAQLLCGDFNARCGKMDVDSEGVPEYGKWLMNQRIVRTKHWLIFSEG